MKHFILGTLVLLTLVGCATFGIHNANSEDGREGRDYTLLVRAWDKKAPNVAVTFLYRINGGAWNEARGVFNGSMYEARINGSQLPAGILEYYAWMTNAKGERVNSQPVQIRILSFAEARAKAERQYQARLADAGTDKEFFFNDTGRIRLQVRGGDPASLSLLLNPERPFQVQTTRNGDLTRHEAEIEAPHRVRSYGYQWKAVWNDPEFGEIISVFPQAPAQVPVIDSAVLRERLEKEIIAAFSHQAPVKGSFAAPPNAQVSLADNALLSRFSAGARSVTLLLRKGTFVRAIPMTEQAKGRFTLALPVQDLEDGALSYSFVYSEVFKDIGKIDYTYPQSGSLLVEYTTLEQLRKALSEQLSTKIVHAAPAQIEENQNITLEMRLSDTSLSIQSSSVELQAYPVPRAIATFSPGAAQGSFFTALPSQLIPTILLEYRIAVTVQDPALGKVTGYLPAAGFFRVPVVKPGTATPTPAATATPAPATPIPVVTVTPTATPSPQATPTPTVTPGPAPTFNPVNYYRGNRDTRQGVRFYVTLPNELGLFDIKVMVKVQNRDQDFKEYPLTRKGKEYSYTFPTLTLLIGNRIDYYYVVYYKGNLVQNLTDANAVPFYTIVQ